MKRVMAFFHDMKFRYKLLCTYLFVCVIPIVLLGSFCVYKTRDYFIQQAGSRLAVSLKQAEASIDRKLSDQERIAWALSFNSTVLSALNKQYGSYYEMYDQCIVQLSPVLQTVFTYNSVLEEIRFYSGANDLRIGPYILPISEVSGAEWYQEVMADGVPHWIVQDGERLFLAQQIVNLRGESFPNLLYLETSYRQMFEPLYQIDNGDYGLYVLDGQGRVLFEKKPSGFPQLPPEGLGDISQREVKGEGAAYSLLTVPFSSHDMSICFYQPVGAAGAYVGNMLGIVFLIIALCAVLSMAVSWLMMLFVVRRIEWLTGNMQAIQNGEMEVWVTSQANDEIGVMIHTFGAMMGHIRQLIQQVRETAAAKREFQLKALYTQVNPHFLYNALSVINWKAIDVGAEDISEVTQLLSTFYRTALNHGKDTITVANELENVRAYLGIQQIMHDREFKVDFQVQEEAQPLQIPNFILQPLVENALLHGIDNMTGRQGLIQVSCSLREDRLLFQVTDNGCGIPAQRLATVLTQDSDGFGIKNVNERIQLFYGKEYGVSVASTEGEGTQAAVTLPCVRQP